MLDVNGSIIKEGDILLGKFDGHNDWWLEYAIVRNSPNCGLVLETEGHNICSFDHPKFNAPERREIVTKLPDKWNAAYKDQPCKYCNIKKKTPSTSFEKNRRDDVQSLSAYFKACYEYENLTMGEIFTTMEMLTMKVHIHWYKHPPDPIEGYDRSKVWTPNSSSNFYP